MKVTVRKSSVRRLTRLKRLPRRFRMFVAGCWLYDVLKANRLHNKVLLGDLNYWLVCNSLDARHLTIKWIT